MVRRFFLESYFRVNKHTIDGQYLQMNTPYIKSDGARRHQIGKEGNNEGRNLKKIKNMRQLITHACVLRRTEAHGRPNTYGADYEG